LQQLSGHLNWGKRREPPHWPKEEREKEARVPFLYVAKVRKLGKKTRSSLSKKKKKEGREKSLALSSEKNARGKRGKQQPQIRVEGWRTWGGKGRWVKKPNWAGCVKKWRGSTARNRSWAREKGDHFGKGRRADDGSRYLCGNIHRKRGQGRGKGQSF